MKQANIIVKLPKLYDAGGDVSQPAKRWFVYYTAREPHTGKNKRFKVYDGFAELPTEKLRRAHAEKIIADLTQKLKTGYNPFVKDDVIYQDDLRYRDAAHVYKKEKGKLRSVPFLASLFMESKKNTLRLSSEHTYRSKMRYLKEYCEANGLKESDVSAFNTEKADGFIRYLFTVRKLGNKSVNEYIRLMREFWDYINVILMSDQREVSNVFKSIKTYRYKVKKPRPYNMNQIRKLGSVIEPKDKQLWIMIRLLFNSFIRPNELRFLKIENVDFVASRILIPADISKNKKDAWVDVPEYIMEDMILSGYHIENPSHFVFTTKRIPGTKPVSKNYFYKRFCKFRDEAGLSSDFILYGLKHSGVAELKRSGADWLDIKNQLRHHSLDQVIEYGTDLLGKTSEHIRKKGPKI